MKEFETMTVDELMQLIKENFLYSDVVLDFSIKIRTFKGVRTINRTTMNKIQEAKDYLDKLKA